MVEVIAETGAFARQQGYFLVFFREIVVFLRMTDWWSRAPALFFPGDPRLNILSKDPAGGNAGPLSRFLRYQAQGRQQGTVHRFHQTVP
jgi:hypothetical protein